ncbi:MAG: hypothetical protein M0C28_05255 [Candidatus Moduliflexus flocculans]|nr:hypothetical protein [Candidatus Moduliflexus flocculans]
MGTIIGRGIHSLSRIIHGLRNFSVIEPVQPGMIGEGLRTWASAVYSFDGKEYLSGGGVGIVEKLHSVAENEKEPPDKGGL